MTRKELAALLDISGAMVTRLAKRGMPTDSLERAQRWRKRHLEPGRMKGTRFDPNEVQPARPSQNPAAVHASDMVVRAISMMNIAAVASQAGQSIDSMVPMLRAALHAVPKHERGQVWPLPLELMDILVADVAALCGSQDAGQPATEAATMSDAEAELMGEFWYAVAAGEWCAT